MYMSLMVAAHEVGDVQRITSIICYTCREGWSKLDGGRKWSSVRRYLFPRVIFQTIHLPFFKLLVLAACVFGHIS